MVTRTDNLRITDIRPVDPPAQIIREIPLSENAARQVATTRHEIQEILAFRDDRLIVVVGPCSIHDPEAALAYGRRLLTVRSRTEDALCLVMRVYFEKPRTRTGWKGLINDPFLDGSFQINRGLRLARQLLRDLNELGLPAGTEFLDIVTGQYLSDLVSWGAIGARTTESQVHREMASGLSCPVGFKNGTDGNLKIACDALCAAAEPHIFLSPTKEGRTAIFVTQGNRDSHLILRGGRQPNYDPAHVAEALTLLEQNGLPPRLMIDFSHANSQKDFRQQKIVARNVATQIQQGKREIIGVMIESHLVEGRQSLPAGPGGLTFGQSITDACLGWDDTEALLTELARAVRQRRNTL